MTPILGIYRPGAPPESPAMTVTLRVENNVVYEYRGDWRRYGLAVLSIGGKTWELVGGHMAVPWYEKAGVSYADLEAFCLKELGLSNPSQVRQAALDADYYAAITQEA